VVHLIIPAAVPKVSAAGKKAKHNGIILFIAVFGAVISHVMVDGVLSSCSVESSPS
jgi:hypothetical protein